MKEQNLKRVAHVLCGASLPEHRFVIACLGIRLNPWTTTSAQFIRALAEGRITLTPEEEQDLAVLKVTGGHTIGLVFFLFGIDLLQRPDIPVLPFMLGCRHLGLDPNRLMPAADIQLALAIGVTLLSD
jgi:hypothetical protein